MEHKLLIFFSVICFIVSCLNCNKGTAESNVEPLVRYSETPIRPNPSASPRPKIDLLVQPSPVPEEDIVEFKAKLLVENVAKMEGLTWPSTDVPLDVVVNGEEQKIIASISGNFVRKDWGLLLNDKVQKLNKEGQFVFKTEVFGSAYELRILLIGPNGEIERSKLGLSIPTVQKIKQRAREKPVKSYFGNVGVGWSTLGYAETGIGVINQSAFTVRGNYIHLIKPPYVDLGASFFYNAATFGGLESYSVRFLGMNVRLGYVFPQVKDPWRFSLLGGIYYTTSFYNDLPVGYQHIAGPQIFPNVRRIFKSGEAFSAYFKFSPITNGIQLLSFSNREVAFGGAYIWPIGSKSISLSIDFSDLSILFESLDVLAHSRSITIGTGIGF